MHCMELDSSPEIALLTKSSMIERNAVRVFPEPVGEQSRRWSPSKIVGIARFCGSVKSSNLSVNQFLTGGERRLRISSVSADSVTCNISGIFTKHLGRSGNQRRN